MKKNILLPYLSGMSHMKVIVVSCLFILGAFSKIYAQHGINSIKGVYVERAVHAVNANAGSAVENDSTQPFALENVQISNGDVLAFDIPGFDDYIEENKIILSQIVLLIDNIKLSEFPAYIENTETDVVRFRFLNKRLSFENRKQLYKLPGKSVKEALIGIKIDESHILYFNQSAKLSFNEIKYWGIFGLILIAAFIGLFFLLIYKYKSVIKDSISGLPRAEDVNPSFSYSKSQFAFWTLIVIVSFIYIWAFTGDTDSLNNTALILLGITSATIVTGNLINKKEESKAVSEALQNQLRDYRTSKNSNFIIDILSDSDGISIHRLQAVVFNLVFGIAFLKSVIFDYTMPEFSDMQFVLIGLSSGTYAFLKSTEDVLKPSLAPTK